MAFQSNSIASIGSGLDAEYAYGETNMRLCAIVPSYNGSATLEGLLETLLSFSQNIVVIDDGSEDNTASIAENYIEKGVVCLRHESNRGKGAALRTGFYWAIEQGFDTVVTLDSDLQHDPKDLPRILEIFERNNLDVLVGSRIHENGGMPFIRRFGNRFSSWIATRFCHQNIPDSQCGYRIYRLNACRSVMDGLMLNRFDAETEILVMAALNRLRIGFAPVSVIYPDDGTYQSHYRSFWDTALIVWFYTREYCRRSFTRLGRKEVRMFKKSGLGSKKGLEITYGDGYQGQTLKHRLNRSHTAK
jgi:glycosyltransferase involved in cell wall biosynthesis